MFTEVLDPPDLSGWVAYEGNEGLLAFATVLGPGQRAAVLDEIDPDTLDDVQAVTYAELLAAVVNWATARQAQARLVVSRACDRARVDWTDVALAGAENISPTTAWGRLAQAKDTIERLPGLFALHTEGRLSAGHLAAVLEVTRPLSVEDCHRVDTHLVPVAPQLAPGLLKRRARTLTAAIDPQAFADRRAKAVEDRTAYRRPAENGMGFLGLLAPAERVEALWLRLDTQARALRDQRDPRTLAQLRADLLCDALITDPHLADRLLAEAEQTEAEQTDTEPAETGDADTVGTAPARSARWARRAGRARRPRRARRRERRQHGQPVRMVVHISDTTLLGLDDTPAEIDGLGPIPASVARDLSAQARDWWRLVYDPSTGVCKDYGRLKRRFPADLGAYIRARDKTCRVIGCERPIADLDHCQECRHGGVTSAENGCGLCEHHHVVKTETTLAERNLPDGTTRWTTPTGHTYDRPPEDHRLGYPEPNPPPEPEPSPDPDPGPCPF
jgi:hypothetical protein